MAASVGSPGPLPRLRHHFGDPALLRQALTHGSFGSPHNERLEFLGDAVLNCAVSVLLYERFPQLDEGALTRLRANLVNQAALAAVAGELALGEALRLGDSELRSGSPVRPSILADALEAVWGALYLDGGFDVALEAARAAFAARLDGLDPQAPEKDPKTRLQEWLQAHRMALPAYQVRAVSGPPHELHFVVECAVPERGVCTVGEGRSRRLAEQAAAARALEEVGGGR